MIQNTLEYIFFFQPCTPENKGHCECGDTSQGFQTYVYKGLVQRRCFTIFTPQNGQNESLPVMFSPNCYAKDQLKGIDMVNKNSLSNHLAERYGYVRIGISTPEGKLPILLLNFAARWHSKYVCFEHKV